MAQGEMSCEPHASCSSAAGLPSALLALDWLMLCSPPPCSWISPTPPRAALLQLRDLADPALQGVLQALKEDALYLWKEETLLILNDAGTLIDLEDKPLLDSTGQPLLPTEGLEQVALEQKTCRWCNVPWRRSSCLCQTLPSGDLSPYAGGISRI